VIGVNLRSVVENHEVVVGHEVTVGDSSIYIAMSGLCNFGDVASSDTIPPAADRRGSARLDLI
jgi:hypothetical protein